MGQWRHRAEHKGRDRDMGRGRDRGRGRVRGRRRRRDRWEVGGVWGRGSGRGLGRVRGVVTSEQMDVAKELRNPTLTTVRTALKIYIRTNLLAVSWNFA